MILMDYSITLMVFLMCNNNCKKLVTIFIYPNSVVLFAPSKKH